MFIPSSRKAPEIIFRITALLAAGLLLLSCGGSDPPTKSDGDTTPPTVKATIPADNATNIARDTSISVVFSEPVDSLTVSSSTFSIDGGVSGSYSFVGDTVRLTPSSNLAYGTTYTATISTAVTDTADNKLQAVYSWSFKTVPDPSTTPPVVVSTVPGSNASDVVADDPIRATFSKELDSTTLTTSTFTLDNGATGTVTYANKVATFTPTQPLNYNTQYTVTISATVADTLGIHLVAPYQWSFTTQTNPLYVVSTVPADNSTSANAVDPITATFSLDLDSTTVTTSSFTINNGVTGVVSYSNKVATFTPSDTLMYSTRYTATISTDIADTSGIHLDSPFQFSFTTQVNPFIPLAFIDSPADSAIVGDTAHISVFATHPIGVVRIELYVDGVHMVGADIMGGFGSFDWDATASDIGTPHRIYVKAYDADNRVGVSDTLVLYHRWQTLAEDINDPWPTDIRRVLGRSTDSLLELRYEFWGSWADAFNDTSFDLGVYLDVDNFSMTGRTDFAGTPLNGIGADYLMIVGVHGDTALSSYNQATGKWDFVFNPNGFAYLNIADSSDFFEVGIKWSDLSNPDAVQFVSINVLLVDQVGSFLADWAPDQGNGHTEVIHSNRYIGPPYTPPPVSAVSSTRPLFKPGSLVPPNPFK